MPWWVSHLKWYLWGIAMAVINMQQNRQLALRLRLLQVSYGEKWLLPIGTSLSYIYFSPTKPSLINDSETWVIPRYHKIWLQWLGYHAKQNTNVLHIYYLNVNKKKILFRLTCMTQKHYHQKILHRTSNISKKYYMGHDIQFLFFKLTCSLKHFTSAWCCLSNDWYLLAKK